MTIQEIKIVEGQDPSVFLGDVNFQLSIGWGLVGQVSTYFTQASPDLPWYIATLIKVNIQDN